MKKKKKISRKTEIIKIRAESNEKDMIETTLNQNHSNSSPIERLPMCQVL